MIAIMPGRIAEDEIADHHRARAGEHVFDDVLDLDDAAAADDRDLHRLGALIDHAHDDRLDAGPREPAELVADRRPERVGVDLEAEDGVRDDQRVGARGLRRLADGDDVAGIGRELRPDRLVGGLADAGSSRLKVWSSCSAKLPPPGSRVGQEMLTSMHVDVGTSDVARHGLEILGRRRRDAGRPAAA